MRARFNLIALMGALLASPFSLAVAQSNDGVDPALSAWEPVPMASAQATQYPDNRASSRRYTAEECQRQQGRSVMVRYAIGSQPPYLCLSGCLYAPNMSAAEAVGSTIAVVRVVNTGGVCR